MYFTLLLYACGKKESAPLVNIDLPKVFPTIQEPVDNAYSQERFELGRLLFYDPILSLDSSISCGSCHEANKAFATNNKVEKGVYGRLGTRNVPSLANIGLHPYFTREGGVPSLEQHVLVPIQEHNEMAFNLLEASNRLETHKHYAALCQESYPDKPLYYAITKSIAVFQRTFISNSSRFDAYHFQNNTKALSDSEIRGMQLFYSSRTNCSVCHNGANFTNYAFENNGLYMQYKDSGRYKLTRKNHDIATFKVASLRNVELTAPYMHDGSMKSLEDVVEHYNKGGENNPRKSTLIQKMDLSSQEKQDLIHFLSSLTDEKFISNNKFKKQ